MQARKQLFNHMWQVLAFRYDLRKSIIGGYRFMLFDNNRKLDPELKRDLSTIINSVEEFAYEKDSILTSLLRQKRLPELYENLNN
jgi:hypothetical protein